MANAVSSDRSQGHDRWLRAQHVYRVQRDHHSIACVHIAVVWAHNTEEKIQPLALKFLIRFERVHLQSYNRCSNDNECERRVELVLTKEFYKFTSDVKRVSSYLSFIILMSRSSSIIIFSIAHNTSDRWCNWRPCWQMRTRRTLNIPFFAIE